MSLALELKEMYFQSHPGWAAESVERMSAAELEQEINSLSPQAIVAVLDRLASSRATHTFEQLNQSHKIAVLRLASPRLGVQLISELSEDAHTELLDSLDRVTRTEIERFLNYPENSAGRLMDKTIEVHVNMSLDEIRTRLRESKVHSARSVYVVDEQKKLIGHLNVQELALVEPGDELKKILHHSKVAVTANAHKDDIVEFLNKTRLDSVPVVDSEGRLIGVVRYQELFEVIEDDASADLLRMVGGSADERSLSPPSFAIKRRLPWLHINLLTAFAAAAVVSLFESLIAQFTALAVLLPVVAGQSGNAGSQALAVTMRGIALKEISIKDWKRILNKEVIIGGVDGIALAFTCGLGVFVWSGSLGLAIVIAVAMVLSMIAAGIAGALVPILLIRFGQDPATAASIILTTVTDVAGFFAFLGTATVLSFML